MASLGIPHWRLKLIQNILIKEQNWKETRLYSSKHDIGKLGKICIRVTKQSWEVKQNYTVVTVLELRGNCHEGVPSSSRSQGRSYDLQQFATVPYSDVFRASWLESVVGTSNYKRSLFCSRVQGGEEPNLTYLCAFINMLAWCLAFIALICCTNLSCLKYVKPFIYFVLFVGSIFIQALLSLDSTRFTPIMILFNVTFVILWWKWK